MPLPPVRQLNGAVLIFLLLLLEVTVRGASASSMSPACSLPAAPRGGPQPDSPSNKVPSRSVTPPQTRSRAATTSMAPTRSRTASTTLSASHSQTPTPVVTPTPSPTIIKPATTLVPIATTVPALSGGAQPIFYVLTNDSATPMQSWGAPTPKLEYVERSNTKLVGVISPPARIGFFNLTYTPVFAPGASNAAVAAIVISVELSCSDGIVCNGYEQLVARRARATERAHDAARGLVYACAAAPRELCDDGIACTIDSCLAYGVCQHIRNASFTVDECPDCTCLPSCSGLVCGDDTCGGSCGACPSGSACSADQTSCAPCTPSCNGAVCGDDGCGGSCGSCAADQVCSLGTCAVPLTEGTCASPISLNTSAASVGWSGTLYLQGDNRLGKNEIVPACNLQSDAPEIIYQIDVPPSQGFVGLWAMVGSCDWTARALTDTVLYVIQVAPGDSVEATCLASSANSALQVGCSDDSNPPGGVGSAVYYQMKAGYTYLLGADSYAANTAAPYCLNVTFVPGCTPDCTGAFCGDSGCPGFSCGSCDAGYNCSYPSQRCQNEVCQPSCDGRTCGDDGCGGNCGSCTSGNVCASDGASGISACVPFTPCNSVQPTCPGGCTLGQFCGTDCVCHFATDSLADITFLVDEVQPEIDDHVDFSPSSCALEHGCIGGIYDRRLLRFSTNIANVGGADYSPPDPAWQYPWVYKWNSCHGHYHTEDALRYLLLNIDSRSTVVFGKKSSYCIEDSNQLAGFIGPNVQCAGHSSCDYQGLQSGWEDVYGPALDCQWLDITDVAPGHYTLQLCANMGRTYQEATFENNCVEVNVTIPTRPPRV